MRKILVAIAVAAMISVAGSADAQSPAPEAAPAVIAAPVVQDTPVYTRSRSVRSSKRVGPFSKLMEIERRKNAWLRRTFLGR